MKDINQRAMELNRLCQVLEVVPYELMALLNDTQRQFIREMAVHLGVEGETLIQQVAINIDETLQDEGVPPKAEKKKGQLVPACCRHQQRSHGAAAGGWRSKKRS
jgi:hypothetical protein